ncbi:CvpA family protein [Desulfoscipio sp. XC116]|uniref:CvpA family protein n=1 Tax=Desulfoscipio sp. XC116 TaxID=3144975 RepID=UPI00325B3056
MNWLDWVLIVIIAFSALRGLSGGFFAGVARIIGLILGIAVAFTGYRPLAAYLDKQWGWGDNIAEFLVNRFSHSLLQEIADKFSIDKFGQNIPYSNSQLISEGLSTIAHQIAVTLLEFLSFIVLLLVVALIVRMIMRFFSGAVAHTFLSPLDHLGGLLLGLVRGVIIVLIVALLIEPVLAAGVITSQEKAGFISRAAASSLVISYAYQLLNILNIHFSLWQSSGGLSVLNGCKNISRL